MKFRLVEDILNESKQWYKVNYSLRNGHSSYYYVYAKNVLMAKEVFELAKKVLKRMIIKILLW